MVFDVKEAELGELSGKEAVVVKVEKIVVVGEVANEEGAKMGHAKGFFSLFVFFVRSLG